MAASSVSWTFAISAFARSRSSRCNAAVRNNRSRSAFADAVPASRPARSRSSSATRSKRSRSAVARPSASPAAASMEAPVDAVRDIGRSSGVPFVEGRSSVSRSDMECLHDRYYRGPEDHDEERREDEENHGKEHLDRSGTRLFFRELTAAHAYLARELSERTRKR